MKTAEENKIVRIYKMIIVWTLFTAITVYGMISAAEKTAFISDGKETETIVFSTENHL